MAPAIDDLETPTPSYTEKGRLREIDSDQTKPQIRSGLH